LIHGDRHGVQAIPFEIAAQIPEEAEKIMYSENELKQFCQSPQFSLEGLSKRLEQASRNCL
jgi:hypothetical protein